MRRQGKSKAEFYEAVGIKSGNMSNWRREMNYPSMPTLVRISNYLGVNLMQSKETEPSTSKPITVLPHKSKPVAEGPEEPSADELMEVLQAYRENPGLRVLFHASKKSKADDFLLAADYIRRLREDDETD